MNGLMDYISPSTIWMARSEGLMENHVVSNKAMRNNKHGEDDCSEIMRNYFVGLRTLFESELTIYKRSMYKRIALS